MLEWLKVGVEGDIGPVSTSQLAQTVAALLLLYGLNWWWARMVARRVTSATARYHWLQGGRYVAMFLGLLVLSRIWINGLHSLWTFVGLVAAALTISQKEMLIGLTGWGSILWRGLFVVGDRVQVGAFTGDVVGQGPLYFTLLEVGNWVGGEQSTGRLVKVPNGMVWTQPIVNYTLGFPYIWNEVSYVFTADSDWRRAKGLLAGIATEISGTVVADAREALNHTSDFALEFHKLEPVVYLKLKQDAQPGFQLTLRYLVKPRRRRDSENQILERLLDAIQDDPRLKLCLFAPGPGAGAGPENAKRGAAPGEAPPAP